MAAKQLPAKQGCEGCTNQFRSHSQGSRGTGGPHLGLSNPSRATGRGPRLTEELLWVLEKEGERFSHAGAGKREAGLVTSFRGSDRS